MREVGVHPHSRLQCCNMHVRVQDVLLYGTPSVSELALAAGSVGPFTTGVGAPVAYPFFQWLNNAWRKTRLLCTG